MTRNTATHAPIWQEETASCETSRTAAGQGQPFGSHVRDTSGHESRSEIQLAGRLPPSSGSPGTPRKIDPALLVASDAFGKARRIAETSRAGMRDKKIPASIRSERAALEPREVFKPPGDILLLTVGLILMCASAAGLGALLFLTWV